MAINLAPLSGKRILVTGGTTGIGRATVALLVSHGARVLTFGRNQADLEASLAHANGQIGDGGGEVYGLTADVATAQGIDAVFAEVDQRLGGLDILVANAALGATPVHEMDKADIRYVVDTNLTGYLTCAHDAIERMTGEGHLLFVSSISPKILAPGESVYAGTKAGIIASAETLRKELKPRNIRVSVVLPGSVHTPMQEASEEDKDQAVAENRMLEAEDIAESILFILTRPPRSDIVTLRIEPLLQETP
jgi:3-hydroxy acid dehydrogenase / malonic semialdehyde reductase